LYNLNIVSEVLLLIYYSVYAWLKSFKFETSKLTSRRRVDDILKLHTVGTTSWERLVGALNEEDVTEGGTVHLNEGLEDFTIHLLTEGVA
jgi:uncharacterized iron-regulated protein